MPNQQLFDYINQQLQQGLTKEQIKNSLLSNGWQVQDIENAFISLIPPLQPITQNINVPQPSSPGISKFLKIILGIATFWPIFYTGTFLIFIPIFFFLFLFNGIPQALGVDLNGFFSPLFILLNKTLFPVFYYPTIILTFILSIIYILIIFKNRRISKKEKTRWTIMFLGIFFAPLINTLGPFSNTRTDIIGLIAYLLVITSIFLTIISLLAMPIYWHRYIWKEPKQNQLP